MESSSHDASRYVAFGLELFNSALRRNRFDFHDPAIIARLDAMIVVVGNALYSTSTPVLILGMKAAAGIVDCPLKTLDKSIPVFVQQIIDIIKQTGNTESEVVQVALKSLASILREGGTVEVKEKDLVYLLELLSPDLEDPSRQGAVFTMLRAIVARKFVVPEIYDIMDKVSEILVTSQSPQVQELCRGVFLQFLLDYPQGKGRLRNQMTFFAKNLSYVYESGRKSIMELLSAIISKFQVALVLEYADLLFVALVMAVANDDSAKCREMASVLIKSLCTRLDDDRRKVILSHLHSWASQYSQPQLTRVSLQVYGFVIDVLAVDSLPYITVILEDVNAALQRSAQELAAIEAGESSMQVDLEWQASYYALTVLTKILRVFPDHTSHENRVAWNLVIPHLLYPHAWVRTTSCRLLGLLFTAVTVQPPRSDLADDNPLSLTGMRAVAMKLCQQLKSEHLDEALSLQVVKNLFYLGKSFYAIPVADLPPEDDNFEETNQDAEKESKSMDPLPWLFSKLSYQIKSAHIERRNRSSNAVCYTFRSFRG
jgi:U3 small nucleolar RNA-associated protein 20